MANTKISDLTDGGVATATDQIPVNRAGANRRVVTGQQRLRLSSDYLNDTTTMSNLSMSANLTAGRTYSGKLVIFAQCDSAADGIKIDFDGGTATMTSVRIAITANEQLATTAVTRGRISRWRLASSPDSGSPLFLLIDGAAVAISHCHFATSGPDYSSHIAAINAIVTGDGKVLTIADLSGFTVLYP